MTNQPGGARFAAPSSPPSGHFPYMMLGETREQALSRIFGPMSERTLVDTYFLALDDDDDDLIDDSFEDDVYEERDDFDYEPDDEYNPYEQYDDFEYYYEDEDDDTMI